MKKISFKYFAFFLLLLTTSSCFRGEESLAPAHLKGYIIGFHTQKAAKFDSNYLNKTVYYEFKKNGTYRGTIDGQAVNFGSYTYHRLKHNGASIMMSYSDKTNQHGLDHYQTILIFTDSSNGTWEARFDIDAGGIDSGTFHIVRHGK